MRPNVRISKIFIPYPAHGTSERKAKALAEVAQGLENEGFPIQNSTYGRDIQDGGYGYVVYALTEDNKLIGALRQAVQTNRRELNYPQEVKPVTFPDGIPMPNVTLGKELSNEDEQRMATVFRKTVNQKVGTGKCAVVRSRIRVGLYELLHPYYPD